MKKRILLSIFLLLSVGAFGQNGQTINRGPIVPVACDPNYATQALFYKSSDPQKLYKCVSGTYTEIGVGVGGGGGGGGLP